MDSVKELEINGRTYQIAGFDARTGSKLLARLMARFIKMGSEAASDNSPVTVSEVPADQAENPNALLQFLLLNLSDVDFDYVQTHALAVVTRLEGDSNAPLPITRNGVITPKDLKDDIATIMQLTSESLFANLSPFFTKAAIQKQMQAQATVS